MFFSPRPIALSVSRWDTKLAYTRYLSFLVTTIHKYVKLLESCLKKNVVVTYCDWNHLAIVRVNSVNKRRV